MSKSRKELSPGGLWGLTHGFFSKEFPKDKHKKVKSEQKPTVVDSLMSCAAVFNLKFPSLLQYDQQRREDKLFYNLRQLFHVQNAPCDTTMREHLDEIEPDQIRGIFKEIFSSAQRGKMLESYSFWEGHYLIAGDATQHFSSNVVHCDCCCEKKHRNKKTGEIESITYHHNMLGAVMVHPDMKQVIPLCPEAITKQDGIVKNDCEQNAAKRLLADIRREHPHLKIIMVEDSLYSTGPHILELRKHGMRFIINAKEGNLSSLFHWVEYVDMEKYAHDDRGGTHHEYRFVNNVPLNEENSDILVNFLEYIETNKNGKKQRFSWITDIPLSKKTVELVMRGGRSRWHIENETFNTLKNQGYNFEHNFGHGKKNLCTVMAMLMMLAFLIDQIVEGTHFLFQQAKKCAGNRRELWVNIRVLIQFFFLSDWDFLFNLIISKKNPSTA